MIPVEKLVPFDDHPYKVLDDDSMNDLIGSVQNSGVDSMNRRKAAEKEIEKLLKRNEEIDRLFPSMYEDKIKGSISEERFAKMTQGYEKEQADNQKRIIALYEQLKSDVKQVDTTKVILDIVDRTVDPEN